uniref:Bacterial surface antigen (D15) domain-containing protein n=1 Tax=Aegilops tauschii subsp. strangulata TaxID=200361 RepID=A0A453FUI2_AEGTS
RRHHQGQFQDPRLPHRGGGRRPAPLCRHRAGPGARLQPCQRAAAPPRRVRLRLHHPRRRPARVPRYCNRHHPSRGGGQTLQSWHLLLPQERGEYGWDQSSKIDIGVYLPRLKSIPTPLTARASILSEDWLKFSSYKQRLLGLKFGLLSTWHHNLSYDLAWRTLTDPSQMASESIRRQLGHNLLSALSYAYKIDKRDSEFRPTKGYAFVSTSQVGGLWKNGLRFFRQEFDGRGAVPLGFCNAALNVGISAGVILPLSRGFMELSSPVPDRFYLGGLSSPVCSLGVISSLLGFKTRGVGP